MRVRRCSTGLHQGLVPPGQGTPVEQRRTRIQTLGLQLRQHPAKRGTAGDLDHPGLAGRCQWRFEKALIIPEHPGGDGHGNGQTEQQQNEQAAPEALLLPPIHPSPGTAPGCDQGVPRSGQETGFHELEQFGHAHRIMETLRTRPFNQGMPAGPCCHAGGPRPDAR